MDASRIDRAAVIGGGLMGVGFAHILGQAGCHVSVVDMSDQLLERSMRRVRESLNLFARHGFLEEDQIVPIMSRIRGTTSLEEAAADAQFVIEAAIEDLRVKQEIFERLDRCSPADAILATNTSSLQVGDIAQRVSKPERVVGSHFFYPHTLVPLVEVVYGPRTADEVVERTVAFWKRCGKAPVVCRKDVNGFIVNRIQAAVAREATSMVSQGVASAKDVDRAIRLGMGVRLPLVGTLEQRDWGGLDVHYAAAQSVYPTLENAQGPLPMLVEKVARGETGAKAGKGFYDWTGKDVEALRLKKEERLLLLIKALREIMPEDDQLVDNS